MRRLLFSIVFGAWAAVSATAATTPLYVNSSPLVNPPLPPQIDATAFRNESLFWVNLFGEFPYQILNNVYFTNTGSGDMRAFPGFQWSFYTNNTDSPMHTWINSGYIEGSTYLLANATNITNRGSLQIGPAGIMRLEGKNVSVAFSELSSRTPTTTGGTVPIPFLWGTGTNGVLSGTSAPVRLDMLNFPRTPPFQMTDGFFIYGPGTIGGPLSNYASYAWSTVPATDTTLHHFAFVLTNALETNITINATLRTNPVPLQLPGSGTIQLDFTFPDYNPNTDAFSTNGVTVTDSIAFLDPLRLVFPTNFFPNRPNAINITAYTPPPTNAIPANSMYSSDVVYNSMYSTNRADMPYAGYFVDIPAIGGGGFFGPDPTNFPGRVEVLGDNVNLSQALIQAETTIIVKAKNLASNKVARTYAPFIALDLASTQPTFAVTDLIPSDISRLSGSVYAWSGFWTNTLEDTNAMTTNYVVVHVLVVDPFLQTKLPVVTAELALSATNLVINDLVNLGTYAPYTPAYSNYYNIFFSYVSGTRMQLTAHDLTVNGGLSLPPAWGWGASNVIGVVNFTNAGLIFIPNSANFGTDRSQPYSNIVNSGTILAGSQAARVTRLENRGALAADEGPITVNAVNAILAGIPVVSFDYTTNNYATNSSPGFPPPRPFFGADGIGSEIRAAGNLEINAGNLTLSNAVLLSGASYVTDSSLSANYGALILNVASNFTDAGIASPSYIWNHGGVEINQRPTNSDLLGTTLVIASDRRDELFNVWAGEDRGLNAVGYSNNLALSRLACNFDRLTLAYFLPTTLANGAYATNAMYVDYLELLNNATNIATSFAIDQNFTIYFANANLDPMAIEADSGGRMRWVSSFAGPLSSANFAEASGRIIKVNSALLKSLSVDSDGDGIVNANDSTPFYTADDAALSVSLSDAPPRSARLTWSALARSANTIEYSDALGSGNWQVLTNFVQGAVTGPVTVLDPLSSGLQLRVYRLRVNPGSN